VVVADGFEHVAVRASLDGKPSPAGGSWKLESGESHDVIVDSDLSFGKDHRSLRFRGRGGRVSLATKGMRLDKDDTITLDCDLFLRSDRPEVWFTPIGDAATKDRTTIALVGPGGKPVASLRAEGGSWHVWNADRYMKVAFPTAIDAWTRVHICIDTRTGTYRVVLQPIGEAPRTIFKGASIGRVEYGTALKLEIEMNRETPRADGPAVDNLRMTRSR
jgi:hypothetical protein